MKEYEVTQTRSATLQATTIVLADSAAEAAEEGERVLSKSSVVWNVCNEGEPVTMVAEAERKIVRASKRGISKRGTKGRAKR